MVTFTTWRELFGQVFGKREIKEDIMKIYIYLSEYTEEQGKQSDLSKKNRDGSRKGAKEKIWFR